MPDYDVVVIGAGPGGYVAAIRAAQLGLNTAVIEKDEVGGICLNWGCIPSKSLLRNAAVLNLVKEADEFGISFDNLSYDYGKAVERSRQVVDRLTTGVSYLLKKNNVKQIKGEAILENAQTIKIQGTGEKLTSNNIIIATGARQRHISSMPIDHDIVINSRDALDLREVPNKIAILGGGATGVEFGHIYRSYGSDVTIVELMDRLIPNEDQEISESLESAMKKAGIKLQTGTEVTSISTHNNSAVISITKDDTESTIECDKVLVAVGVQGNIDDIGLENVEVETNNSFITVNENMETNIPGIYAIGDVTGKLMLAHVASAQAVTAAEFIAGLAPMPLDYTLMPRAIYCDPQVASFGITETQAKEQNIDFTTGKFPFSASGKAIALGETEGMIKLIVDTEVGEILGAHMIGSEVTELLGEVSMVRLLEGTSTELGWLVHPHPTISEMLKEAALDTTNEAIHT